MRAQRLFRTVAMVTATVVGVLSAQAVPPQTVTDSLVSGSNVDRAPETGWPRVRIKDPEVRDAVTRALDEAASRLTTAQCRLLFSDFADRRDRPLGDRLVEMNLSAIDYLRFVVFEDGELDRRCSEKEGLLAFTIVGGRTIHICGQRFTRAAGRGRSEAWATIIHELLHSLGLGESPPTPRSITYRVQQRCW